MNLAQSRLADIAAWIARSSAPGVAPLGEPTIVGPYAVIVPIDVAATPEPDFDVSALPIFVPADQAVGTGRYDTAAPDGQPSLADRLAHLVWKVRQGDLPPATLIGLESPSETLQTAIDRAGAGGVDRTIFPLLALPLWALAPEELDELSRKLPLLQ